MQCAIWGLIGFIAGAGGVWAFIQFATKNMIARARADAEQILSNARQEAANKAKEIELSAKQQQMKLKETFERDQEASRRKLEEHESRLSKREDVLDRKLDTLSVKEKNLDTLEQKLAGREKSVSAKEQQLDGILREQRDRLLQITNLSVDQAKEMLLRRIEDECKQEAGALIQKTMEQAQEEAKEKGRQIILQAIQRYAAEQT